MHAPIRPNLSNLPDIRTQLNWKPTSIALHQQHDSLSNPQSKNINGAKQKGVDPACRAHIVQYLKKVLLRCEHDSTSIFEIITHSHRRLGTHALPHLCRNCLAVHCFSNTFIHSSHNGSMSHLHNSLTILQAAQVTIVLIDMFYADDSSLLRRQISTSSLSSTDVPLFLVYPPAQIASSDIQYLTDFISVSQLLLRILYVYWYIILPIIITCTSALSLCYLQIASKCGCPVLVITKWIQYELLQSHQQFYLLSAQCSTSHRNLHLMSLYEKTTVYPSRIRQALLTVKYIPTLRILVILPALAPP